MTKHRSRPPLVLHQANVDPLTGLIDRRHSSSRLDREIGRADQALYRAGREGRKRVRRLARVGGSGSASVPS